MRKEETIARYGKEAYEKCLKVNCVWRAAHLEEVAASRKKYHEEHREELAVKSKKYHEEHPEQVAVRNHEANRKGGRRYDAKQIYNHTGLQGERNGIRNKHNKRWREYKQIIAPDSQLHHSWLPGTSEYEGLALVEANQHMHGFVDVIEILEGKITIFTEKEIREQFG